jgi:hypothetical protein
MNIAVSINSEDLARETKSSTIGFLVFEKDRTFEKDLRNAQPVGTGTLGRLGTVCGILTAGHVIKRLPTSGEVGIVLFPSITPNIQNLTLDMNYTSNVVIWDGIDGHVPDIGFLQIPSRIVAYIESVGCVFYNFEKTHGLSRTSPTLNLAYCYAIPGIIAEWASDMPGKQPKTRIKDVQGLFLAVKIVREFLENDSRLFECKIHYAADAKVPTSYGGVSGGALWQMDVELSGTRIIGMKKRLYGVAFRQSAIVNGERLIHCQSKDTIEELIMNMKNSWPPAR